MKAPNSSKSIPDLSESVLSRLKKMNVATTPDNYTIWHAYYSGTSEGLNSYIKQLFEEKVTFTEEVNKSIHKRFFGEDHANALKEIRDSIGHIIGETGKELGGIDEEVTKFSRTLNAGKQEITSGTGNKIERALEKLIRGTNIINNSTKSTISSISNLSHEVDELRAKVEQLTKEASTDALTGIANRRVFPT